MNKGCVLIEVVSGCEGHSLSIGDESSGTRIAGPKPWGGGRTIHSFEVDIERLLSVVKEYISTDEDKA